MIITVFFVAVLAAILFGAGRFGSGSDCCSCLIMAGAALAILVRDELQFMNGLVFLVVAELGGILWRWLCNRNDANNHPDN